jgi:hypothetical protein
MEKYYHIFDPQNEMNRPSGEKEILLFTSNNLTKDNKINGSIHIKHRTYPFTENGKKVTSYNLSLYFSTYEILYEFIDVIKYIKNSVIEHMTFNEMINCLMINNIQEFNQ